MQHEHTEENYQAWCSIINPAETSIKVSDLSQVKTMGYRFWVTATFLILTAFISLTEICTWFFSTSNRNQVIGWLLPLHIFTQTVVCWKIHRINKRLREEYHCDYNARGTAVIVAVHDHVSRNPDDVWMLTYTSGWVKEYFRIRIID